MDDKSIGYVKRCIDLYICPVVLNKEQEKEIVFFKTFWK